MERWLSIVARAGWAAAAIAAATLLASLWRPQLGWPMVAIVWGAAVLSAVRPFYGLLLLAGIGPIVTALAIVLHADKAGVHFPEALTLAFIAGAAARRTSSGGLPAMPRRILWPAGILVALALASALVNGALLATEQEGPGSAGRFARTLVADYLVQHNTVTIALQFAEGLVLFVLAAAVSAAQRDASRRVLLMLVAGATGAAVLNIVRIVTAALRQAEAVPALMTYFAQARVSLQFSDWNAAGSFFAMTLLVAIAFASGRGGAGYAIAAATIAVALWLTGSRVAMAAVLAIVIAAALVALWRTSGRQKKLLALAAIALAIAAVVASVLWYPSGRNDSAMFSITTRLELWKAGLRMMWTDPLFGVGLGRFYDLSPDYASATLQVIWRPRENAHNYFIQVLAELGIPGLALFVAVHVLSLKQGWQAANNPLPSRLWLAGPLAFLLTCLTGHSFLIPDVTFAFWITLALAAASGPIAAPVASGARRRFITATALTVLAIAAVLPMRMRAAVLRANMANASEGLSAWQAEPGMRYRSAGSRAAFFVPSGARSVQLRFRAGPDAPQRILVRVFLEGREANQVELQQGEDWRTVRLVQPNRRPLPDFLRIDVETSGIDAPLPLEDAAKVVLVSQPFFIWEK
jgi:O-antigen ligase